MVDFVAGVIAAAHVAVLVYAFYHQEHPFWDGYLDGMSLGVRHWRLPKWLKKASGP